jgi:hypothetical protein
VIGAICSQRRRRGFGGRMITPVVKVAAFGLACLGLWVAGHPNLATALAVFSAAVNGAAQLPAVRAAHETQGRRR